jgi:hypothetical protein
MPFYSIYEYFISNNIHIIIVVILGISIVVLFATKWVDFLLPKKIKIKENEHTPYSSQQKCPKISVIFPVDTFSDTLENNLKNILNQDYSNFDIIVVEESEDKEIDILIDRLKNEYKNIRKTFVPQSYKNICKRKLSITLGTRAARGEWIVLTHPNCIPASNQWLSSYIKYFDDNTDIVLGYTNYDNGINQYYQYKRLRYFLMGLKANQWHAPFLGDASNMAFRKISFLNVDGYAECLGIIGGEAEMLIKAISNSKNTRYNLDKEGFVKEFLPLNTSINIATILPKNTLKYSCNTAKLFLLREIVATIALYISFLSIVVGWLFFAMRWICLGKYDIAEIGTDITLLGLTFTHIVLPLSITKSSTKNFLSRPLKKSVLYWDLIIPFDNLYQSIKYWTMNKYFRYK